MEISFSDQLLQIELGDLATWVTGLITFLALLITLINIAHSRKKENDREEKKQASQISGWVEDLDCVDFATIVIKNSSNNPIYNIITNVHGTSENIGVATESTQTYIRLIKPGTSKIRIDPIGGGMHTRAFLEIGFRDCNGNSWIKNDNGEFRKINESLQDHYELTEPLSWEMPDEES